MNFDSLASLLMAVLCAIQCIHCSSYDSSVGVQTTQPQMCENCRGLGAAGVRVGVGVPQMIHWEEGDDLTDSFRLFGGGQRDPLCLWLGILGAGSQGPCRGPTTACVSQAQHLFREVCADSPAPRHKLFLAVVTVHCSHENRSSSPCLVLPWDTTPGARAAGDPGFGRLTMHCLWSWVMVKASSCTEVPPPVVLRKAQGLDQPSPEGCEVGTGAWLGSGGLPMSLGMHTFCWALSSCLANCLQIASGEICMLG